MRTYEQMRLEINKFMNESGINAFDLVRIAKDLCCCRTCKYFTQHYTKDGAPVDFGHCCHGNSIKSRQPHTNCCGSWECE